MDTYIRLTYDVEQQLERARELRGAYVRRFLRRARVAASEGIGKLFRIAVHPHRSIAH